MERYNLPSGGIEVIITGDHKIQANKDDVYQQVYADTQASLSKRTATAGEAATHQRPTGSLRHIVSHSLLVIAALGIIGNVPVYSRINFPNQTIVDNNDSIVEIELELDKLANEQLKASELQYLAEETELGLLSHYPMRDSTPDFAAKEAQSNQQATRLDNTITTPASQANTAATDTQTQALTLATEATDTAEKSITADTSTTLFSERLNHSNILNVAEATPPALPIISEAINDTDTSREGKGTITLTLEAITPDFLTSDQPTASTIDQDNKSEPIAATEPSKPKAAEYGQWKLKHLKQKTSLTNYLKQRGFPKAAESIADNSDISKTLKTLKSGRAVLLRTQGKQLNQFIYAQSDNKAFIITRYGDKYKGHWDTDNFAHQDTDISFTVTDAFTRSAHKAGVPVSVTRKLVKIFRKDVNFRKIRRGDWVGVIFDDYRYKGKSIAAENLLAAEFEYHGRSHQRIRFTFNDGKTRYLRPNKDIEVRKAAFNRRPIKRGRVSSGFGSRRHPVLGKRRMHKGTDFAAPKGTPIYATGKGSVKFVGRQRGYGKVVELRHPGGITTLYGHMSAFKKGLKSGKSVKRGEVIGYVGSTGRSTGNHVHYEFRVNGKYKNPLSIALPKTGTFSKKERNAFKKHADKLIKQLAKLRQENNTAKNESNKKDLVDG